MLASKRTLPLVKEFYLSASGRTDDWDEFYLQGTLDLRVYDLFSFLRDWIYKSIGALTIYRSTSNSRSLYDPHETSSRNLLRLVNIPGATFTFKHIEAIVVVTTYRID